VTTRLEMLAQAAAVAFAVSAVAAVAYRTGGRRGLWTAAGVCLAVLEGLLLWGETVSPGEAPFWLTALAVIPPVLLAVAVVERLARRRASLAAPVVAGTAAGLAGYVAAAFVAYVVLVSWG
jgi:hypothetical protein